MKVFARTVLCTVLLTVVAGVFGCKPSAAPSPPPEEAIKGMEKFTKPAPRQ
ncbi:MAG TPA: hypothetical protein VN688_16220 [Gemmataceae bacterium]|nr:hypothetical protein [Gemmataceae bacterium]